MAIYYKRGILTKAEAVADFRLMWSELLDFEPQWYGDVIAKREAWLNYTDSLYKDGEITEKQYNQWSCPF